MKRTQIVGLSVIIAILALVATITACNLVKVAEVIPAEFSNSIGMQFQIIPAGEFAMGNPTSEEGYQARELLHPVRINKPFYIGQTEVTVGQFRNFVVATRRKMKTLPQIPYGKVMVPKRPEPIDEDNPFGWENPGFEQTDDHPVTNVTWNDAIAFCEWLSETEQLRYRLPTEAEWEYACRAGTTTRFYSGDEVSALVKIGNVRDKSVAVYTQQEWGCVAGDDGYIFTAPVKQFRPNAFGLYDMIGNVCEMTSDSYSENYFKISPVDDPVGPEYSDGLRTVRGSHWYLPSDVEGDSYRSSLRLGCWPDKTSEHAGFRVVCEIE